MSIYLDHAATCFPRPPAVLAAVQQALQTTASVGRGFGPAARAAQETVDEVRAQLAAFLGLRAQDALVFTSGATAALNLAIHGTLARGKGGVVVTGPFEHHAVLRPLAEAVRRGACREVIQVPPDDGFLATPAALARHLGPEVRLVVLGAVSNVLGVRQDVAGWAAACRAHGVPLLVDASQAVGLVDVSFAAWGADLLAFSGHKGLCGPPGVGGLCLGPGSRPASLLQGGTGGEQAHLDVQPDRLPWAHEPGTLPVAAIAGLGAGLRWVQERGVAQVRQHHYALTRRLVAGLVLCDAIDIPCPVPDVGIVTFTVRGWEPASLAQLLDETFGIALGAGLSCAPAAHARLGTLPQGALRASVGLTTTEADIDHLVEALHQVAAVPVADGWTDGTRGASP